MGVAPTVLEAAYIAQHIYDAKFTTTKVDTTKKGSKDYDKIVTADDKWKVIQIEGGRETLKMGIYIRKNESYKNPSEYVVAFRGTSKDEATKNTEWKNNAEQALSAKSADMWDALSEANKFVSQFGSKEITFVGHSKGGAEAAGAAIHTKRKAIIFNPAMLNLKDYKLGSYKKCDISSYVVSGEILDSIQGVKNREIYCTTDIDGENTKTIKDIRDVEYSKWNYIGNMYKSETIEQKIKLEKHAIEVVIQALKAKRI